MTQEPTDLQESGPIDYLIVEFPSEAMTGEAFPLLVDLVDRGIVRVLDLLVLRKEDDGTVTGLELDELADGTTGLEIFAGAVSGLLGHEDLAEAAEAVEPGRTAAVLVYENVWAAPFATALRRGGAQLVAGGRIPVQAVLAALEADESTD
ncbi:MULTISPECIES: DUF6325 family protein [Oerskovia]|uniref:DUF1269 domain-containing protein n=1 Tax=Oerskovia enterophila TaxID=43678 RepID=A0A163RA59_9CELL|nr:MULTISPECIES: DUF6325 family protein [Oerskovia]KRC35581.1 hypothetical protein ASE15_10655 [Oerskovia sp. Root22]KRD36887.1 hypothetical protein ASE27_10590 [Oerskovia sp. Root918]KZM35003.1 hypothetical protein OJAG_23760 [Oerskovia enterophila]OCI30921.1 hypothetical protein OERS_23750 [Oerskovia enterophila]